MADTTSSFNQATGKTDADEAKRRVKSMMREKQVFEDKAAEYRGNLHSQQTHEQLDQGRKHDDQTAKLDKKLDDAYGANKAKDQEALQALKNKRETSRPTQDDRERAEALQRNLDNIKQRESEQRDALKTRQEADRKKLAEQHDKQNKGAERTIAAAHQDRQSKGWKPEPVNFQKFENATDEKISFQKPARTASEGSESSQGTQTASGSLTSSPHPYLAPKGAKTGNLHPPKEKSERQTVGGKGSSKGNGMGM